MSALLYHFLAQLLCRGVEWTLHKRYRDFYNLHHELIKENQNYNIDLPKLPEKRWFERQRWINRYGNEILSVWIPYATTLNFFFIQSGRKVWLDKKNSTSRLSACYSEDTSIAK